ncbi:MAG: hypothetical protein V3U69_02530 [Bacteroidota bacterium]
MPIHKSFFLAGANPESQHDYTAYKMLSNISSNLSRELHLAPTGGGNVRGLFQDYTRLVGRKIVAVNFELVLQKPLARMLRSVPLVSSIVPVGFVDVGQVWNDNPRSVSR